MRATMRCTWILLALVFSCCTGVDSTDSDADTPLGDLAASDADEATPDADDSDPGDMEDEEVPPCNPLEDVEEVEVIEPSVFEQCAITPNSTIWTAVGTDEAWQDMLDDLYLCSTLEALRSIEVDFDVSKVLVLSRFDGDNCGLHVREAQVFVSTDLAVLDYTVEDESLNCEQVCLSMASFLIVAVIPRDVEVIRCGSYFGGCD